MSSKPGTERPIRHLGPKRHFSLLRTLYRIPFPLRAAAAPKQAGPNPYAKQVGANYDTEWARRLPTRVTRMAISILIWRPVVRFYCSPTVRGTDRMANIDGPVVFASNHFSHVDTPLLMTSIPTPHRNKLVIAAAADYFFPTRFKGAIASIFIGAIPIERSKLSKAAVAEPIQLLKKGWSFVIYPEGGRSPDGWGQPFRPGAAFISRLAEVPVIPVYIKGTRHVLGRGSSLPSRANVTIVFGQPLRCIEGESNKEFSSRIETAVASLADEAVADWWTARKRFHHGDSSNLGGPRQAGWRRRWSLSGSEKRSQRKWPHL